MEKERAGAPLEKGRAGERVSENGSLREEGTWVSERRVWEPRFLPGCPTTPHHHRKYTVRVGEHSLKNKDESEQERAVAQSIPHPCYNSSNNDHSYDLMLIQLRGRVPLGPKVKPIKLADHCPQVGQKCTISGWGTVTSPRGSGKERRSWLAQWTPSHWRHLASRADEEGNMTVRLTVMGGPR